MNENSPTVTFTPIGIFHSPQIHPYEAGRQPDTHHSEGYIQLHSGLNFEQALSGLEVGQRIWIIFQFHHNQHWNPMVLPPRGRDQKIGVFATRSPYRPNNIGMSCVQISKIEKLKIYVTGADILNASPILDIKPYVAYADSFPESEPPWLKNAEGFELEFSPLVNKQLEFLEQNSLEQLRPFIHHQLEFEPTNSKKKRVSKNQDSEEYCLAYRTWRVYFHLDLDQKKVTLHHLGSGYSTTDLDSSSESYVDTYQDKKLHLQFLALWPLV